MGDRTVAVGAISLKKLVGARENAGKYDTYLTWMFVFVFNAYESTYVLLIVMKRHS